MQAPDFDQVLEQIIAKDPRYHRDAYIFVKEALDFTQKLAGKANKTETRHVTAAELLEGIRQYALKLFGPMALTVLNEWGVRSGEDFGEIVFNLVDNKSLAKNEKDDRADFKVAYDFHDAFRKPFLPSRPPLPPMPEPKESGGQPTKAK